jgi:hypothetical protein
MLPHSPISQSQSKEGTHIWKGGSFTIKADTDANYAGSVSLVEGPLQAVPQSYAEKYFGWCYNFVKSASTNILIKIMIYLSDLINRLNTMNIHNYKIYA